MLVHLRPPAAKTLLLGSDVAEWKTRGVFMFPVRLHVPTVGSYSSADFIECGQKQGERGDLIIFCEAEPEEKETHVYPAPSSNPAICRLPVRLHVPVAGLYNSADAMVQT